MSKRAIHITTYRYTDIDRRYAKFVCFWPLCQIENVFLTSIFIFFSFEAALFLLLFFARIVDLMVFSARKKWKRACMNARQKQNSRPHFLLLFDFHRIPNEWVRIANFLRSFWFGFLWSKFILHLQVIVTILCLCVCVSTFIHSTLTVHFSYPKPSLSATFISIAIDAWLIYSIFLSHSSAPLQKHGQ